MFSCFFCSRLWRMETHPLRYPLLPPPPHPLLPLPSRDWPHPHWSPWRPYQGEEAAALGATAITAAQGVSSPTLRLAATAMPPSSCLTRQHSSRPKTQRAPPQLLSPTPSPPHTATVCPQPPLHPMWAHRGSSLQTPSPRLCRGPQSPPTAWASALGCLWGKVGPSAARCQGALACQGCRHPWAFFLAPPQHLMLRRLPQAQVTQAYRALLEASLPRRPTVRLAPSAVEASQSAGRLPQLEVCLAQHLEWAVLGLWVWALVSQGCRALWCHRALSAV